MEKLLARNFTHDYTQSAGRIEQSLGAQRQMGEGLRPKINV